MNIDKFGHHVHKRMRLSNVFDIFDNTLIKTEQGEFNLQLTRLRGIKTPASADDAVNKEYVDQLSQSFCDRKDMHAEIEKLKSHMKIYFKQIIDLNFYSKKDIDNIIKKITK